MKLDEQNSNIRIFNTSYGRYQFNQLQFDISAAPEVFQRKHSELFGYLKGVGIYFNATIVNNRDEKQQDENLKKFMDRTIKYNLMFNRDKLQFKLLQVEYCGHIISKNCIKMSSKFVKATEEFEYSNDRKSLERLFVLIPLKIYSESLPNNSTIEEITKEQCSYSICPII